MLKETLLRTLWLSLFLGIILTNEVYSATEFVCTINNANEDYNTVGTWEGAMDDAGDITAADCKVFSIASVSSDFSDGDTCEGASSGATGTIIHQNNADTQILIDAISGTFQAEQIVGTGGSAGDVTLSDTGDSVIIVCHVYDDQGVCADWFQIDGFTTDSTNYVKVTSPPAERHNGTHAQGAELSGGGNAFRSTDDNSIIEWLILTCTANDSTNWDFFVRVDNPGNIVRNCIIMPKNAGGGATQAGIRLSTQGHAYNNIIYNGEAAGIAINKGSGVTYRVYNNTVYNTTGDGIKPLGWSGTLVCVNNLVTDSGSNDYETSNGDFETMTTCGSEDTTGTITGLSAATEFESITGGSEDFHLASGANSIDAGTDLGDGNWDTDIDNRDRDAEGDTWDIGADEYVEGPPPDTVLRDVVIKDAVIRGAE